MTFFRLFSTLLLKSLIMLNALILLLPCNSSADGDLFPLYPQIENNVSFWEDIYTRYETDQGILHDDEDLSIIYTVIPLAPKTAEGYRKINKKRIDAAKAKYRAILQELIENPKSKNPAVQKTAKLFGPDASRATYLKAVGNLRCQIGQRDRFLEGLKRSGAYLDQIREIFEYYGLPAGLAYLPHVESSFDTQAYSKFGAAGMWQFTRGTGRRFLEIGYTIDERRDPIVSAHAAARLLKENYEKLNSWPLAITAYNHGASGMERAQKLWEDYPEIFENYQSRTFKFASRNFYSEFIAAKMVACNHEKYFGKVDFDSPRRTHSIVMEGFVALDDILAAFDLEVDTIKKLNPAIRQPVFKGQKYIPKGYRLHLPTTITQNEAELALLFSRKYYHSEQRPSHFYAVQEGDTAYKIARMHKIQLSDLLLANNLDKNATIYINQNLRIPLPGEHNISPPAAGGEQKIQPLDLPKIPQPLLASIIPLSFGKAEPSVDESLSPGGHAAEPSEETPLNPEIISGNLKIEEVWTENDRIYGLIKVEVEETLGHIADWLEVETQQIRHLNGLRYGSFVHIGQSLKITLDRVSKEKFEERRFDYHKRLQEDFFNAYQIEEIHPYVVRKGENIWRLSNQKFKLPVWLIQQCNPSIDFQQLRHSEKLMIPVVEKKS